MSTSVAIAFAGGAAVGALAMRLRQSHLFREAMKDKVVSIERDDCGERVIRISKAQEEDPMMDEPVTEQESENKEEQINE